MTTHEAVTEAIVQAVDAARKAGFVLLEGNDGSMSSEDLAYISGIMRASLASLYAAANAVEHFKTIEA